MDRPLRIRTFVPPGRDLYRPDSYSKSDNPATLPVQQATKIELFLNISSAKALGITISPALLARADELIE
jgi:putative ABC transport system substrate-binding protein